jgi:hypothetical protein
VGVIIRRWISPRGNAPVGEDRLPYRALQSKNIVESSGDQHWTRKGTGTVYLY